jgi:hypothetical protein
LLVRLAAHVVGTGLQTFREQRDDAGAGTRRRLLISTALMALIIPAASYAAWSYFSGGSGTASGQLSTATRSDALTFTADGSAVTSDASPTTYASPGGTGDLGVRVTNTAGVTENITGVTGTIVSTPANCELARVRQVSEKLARLEREMRETRLQLHALVLAAHRSGETVSEIARQLDLSRQRIYQMLAAAEKEAGSP